MAVKKQTEWNAAERETVVIDSGDVLLPLKRIRDQYTKRAEELDSKAFGDNRVKILAQAAEYRRCAAAVQRGIGVVCCAVLVEPPAVIDQTEEILSEVSNDAAV